MADARSLLRAAASHRDPAAAGLIQDKWASYHPKTGALRCVACDFLVVKHERLWGAHTLSKTHRANVQAAEAHQARERAHEEERARAYENEHPASPPPADPADNRKRKEAEEATDDDADAKRVRRDTAAVDTEWDEFQRTVVHATAPAAQTYEHATIHAEPELVRDQPTLEDDDTEETDEERTARLEREAREDLLARIDAEQRAQEEADQRIKHARAQRG